MKRGARALFLVLAVVVLLAGCAPGPNDSMQTPDAEGDVAGVLDGLWHGIIAPVTFIISLFTDDTSLYDVHNNGGWYDLGFLLGLSIILGGGGSGARGRKR